MRLSALLVVTITFTFQSLCFGQQNARTWTDATGTYKTQAALVKQTDSAVTLRKSDGQEITIPLTKLSAADLAYLKNIEPASIDGDEKGRTLSAEEVKALVDLAQANNGSVEVENGEIVAIQLGAIKSNVLAKFRDLHTVASFNTYLSYSTLKDEDLAVIGSMKNLQTINLDACGIDGLKGLKSIANLAKLKRLAIGEGGVDDTEMAVLKSSPSIEELDLYSHSLSNGGLKEISAMTNLKKLSLQTSLEHANSVTNAGIAHLSTLKNLEWLELGGDAFTDECIDSILKIPALKQLKVGNTKISDAGKAKLKKTKPELELLGGL